MHSVVLMKNCKSQAKYGNIKLYYIYQIFIYYEGGQGYIVKEKNI